MKNNLIYAENFTLGNNVSLDLSHGLRISDKATEQQKLSMELLLHLLMKKLS